MQIKNEVADVLANSTIEENLLFLPDTQLDRKLYMDVNKVLTAIKGKWNRGKKAHVFPENPSETIEEILATGQYTSVKQDLQQFFTPDSLADYLVQLADFQSGDSILEPSAGEGAIADAVQRAIDIKPDCIEIDGYCRGILNGKGYTVIGTDFTLCNDLEYDVVIGNPPFSKQQDIDHVTKMIEIAQRKVVSVMSASVLFRTNKKTVEFRELIESLGGTIEALPDDSFTSSGTKVNTCVVVVDI